MEGVAATFSLITEWVRFVNFLGTTQVKESAEQRVRKKDWVGFPKGDAIMRLYPPPEWSEMFLPPP